MSRNICVNWNILSTFNWLFFILNHTHNMCIEVTINIDSDYDQKIYSLIKYSWRIQRFIHKLKIYYSMLITLLFSLSVLATINISLAVVDHSFKWHAVVDYIHVKKWKKNLLSNRVIFRLTYIKKTERLPLTKRINMWNHFPSNLTQNKSTLINFSILIFIISLQLQYSHSLLIISKN